MKLHRLTVNNFFSYRHAEIELDNQGAVLVSAPNGRGKSSLFSDAIPWCLFGETIREKIYGKTSQDFKMDDVINDKVKKDCYVSLEFTGVDGKRYLCTRYRKDSEHGTTTVLEQIHSQKGNGAKAQLQCSLLSGENIKETQEKICKLTGMTYETYCNSVLFAQGPVRRFTQCTDAQRREIFEQFFDLEVFNQARELVAEDKKKLSKQIDAQNEDLGREDSLLNRCDLDIADLKESITREEHAVTVSQENPQTQTLKHNIETAKAKIAEWEEEEKGIKKQRSKIKKQLLSKEDQKKLRAEVDAAYEKVRELTSANDRDEVAIEDYAEREALGVGEECPECLRPMKEHDVKEYQKILKRKLSAHKISLAQRTAQLETAKEKYRKLRALRDKNEELLEEDADLSDEQSDLLSDISDKKTELAKLEKSLNSVKSEVSKSEATLKLLKKQLEGKEKEREEINTRRAEIGQKISQLQSQMFKLEFWLDGFSNYGIKNFCYGRLIGILNNKLVQYSQRLTNGEVEVLFSIDAKDKLRVDVKCRRGAKKHILSSNGQQRRADLCIALAFQSIVESGAQPVNVSIIDEFDAGLDQDGLNHLEQYIKEEVKRKSSIFLITHNSQLSGLFSNVLRIEQKDNGESYIK